MVDHNDAVAIAIIGDTQIGFFGQHARLQGAYVGCPDLFVDVEPVRLTTHRDHLSTQLAEHIRGDVIGRAMGAVDNHFERIQAQFVREGAFAEFNITPRGIHDAAGFPSSAESTQVSSFSISASIASSTLSGSLVPSIEKNLIPLS